METIASEDAAAPSLALPSSSSAQMSQWIEAQELLRQRLIERDDFLWELPGCGMAGPGEASGGKVLKYVGGVDMSFARGDDSLACATLVVLHLSTLALVRLEVPYFPGFLAFKEAPVLLGLLEKVKRCKGYLCSVNIGGWKWVTSSSSVVLQAQGDERVALLLLARLPGKKNDKFEDQNS